MNRYWYPQGLINLHKSGDLECLSSVKAGASRAGLDIIIIFTIIIVIIELIHSKTIPEISTKPAALDFKTLSQYCSRTK